MRGVPQRALASRYQVAFARRACFRALGARRILSHTLAVDMVEQLAHS